MQMGNGLGMIQRRFRETPGLFCFIVFWIKGHPSQQYREHILTIVKNCPFWGFQTPKKATKPHHPEIKHLKTFRDTKINRYRQDLRYYRPNILEDPLPHQPMPCIKNHQQSNKNKLECFPTWECRFELSRLLFFSVGFWACGLVATLPLSLGPAEGAGRALLERVNWLHRTW